MSGVFNGFDADFPAGIDLFLQKKTITLEETLPGVALKLLS